MTASVTEPQPVATPYGEGRLVLYGAPDAVATLVLSHGAGGGIGARDLAALAAALPAQGFTVALFEQPWRVAGRKIATAPPTLDVGLVAAVEHLAPGGPLVVGGRSAGARSAARCALGLGGRRLPGIVLPAAPARTSREVASRRADRCRGPDPGGAGGARPDGHARGVP